MAEKIIRISADVSGVLNSLREIPNEIDRAFRFETGNKAFSAIFDKTLSQSKDIVDQIRLIKREIESFQEIRMKPLNDELKTLQKRESDIMSRNIPNEKRSELLEGINTRREKVYNKQDEVVKSIDKLNFQLQKLTDQATRAYSREEKRSPNKETEAYEPGLVEKAKNDLAKLKAEQLHASSREQLDNANKRVRDKQSEIEHLLGNEREGGGSRGGFGPTNVALQAARGTMGGLGIGSAGGLMTTSLGIFGTFAAYEITKKLAESYLQNIRSVNRETLSTGVSNTSFTRGDDNGIFSGSQMQDYATQYRRARGGAFSLYGGDINNATKQIHGSNDVGSMYGSTHTEWTTNVMSDQMRAAQSKEYESIRRQMVTEKFFGLNEGTLNKLGEPLRYQTGTDQVTPDKFAQQMAEKFKSAKVFNLDKGDITRMADKIDQGNEINKAQLEQMGRVDAKLSTNLLTAMGMIPGATGDVMAGNVISTINRSITNPRNDFIKSRNLDLMRIHNKGLTPWDAEVLQSKGIFGKNSDGTNMLSLLSDQDENQGQYGMFDFMQRTGLKPYQVEDYMKQYRTSSKFRDAIKKVGSGDDFNKLIGANLKERTGDSNYVTQGILDEALKLSTDAMTKLKNNVDNFAKSATQFDNSVTTLKTATDNLAKQQLKFPGK